MQNLQNLYAKYNQLMLHPSDINELMPYLHEYSKGFNHITEMGVRGAVSTYAYMMSLPKKLVGYDLGRWPQIDEVEAIAKECGIEYQFIQHDVLKTEIEETDILFIDTFHVAGQCARELDKHHGKVRNRIMFHDIAKTTFWENGEPPYEGLDIANFDMRGLRYAIEPFMAAHPEWKEIFRTEINNGLLVIERQA